MSDQQDRILRLFIEEAKEHLDTLEKGLVDLQSTMEDPENIQEMFRAAHSVKGGAAMLGLDSIKTTAHRLEDCFKILRDDSLNHVDQKAESMFLKGVDTLKELLERLERPFGLRKEEADKMVEQIMPVFADLETHLTALLQGTVPVAATPSGGSKVAPPPANFAPQVMAVLKEMLQVFKQAESPTSRQQLAVRCDRLLQLGTGIETWQTLVKTARAAIANPKTAYKTLAPLVIKELKDGGDLVQAGKAKAIAPSKGLQQLAVVSAPPSPSAPATAAVPATKQKQVTLPLEPKAAVKVLLQNFDKKQLSEIAKLLVQVIKSKG